MLDVQPLSADLQKVAIEELAEVPSRIPDHLRALKEWLKTQCHLKVRTHPQYLIQFLRCCEYDMERAKARLDLWITLKTKYPEMLNATDIDEPKFRKLCSLGTFMALPEPARGNGPRIITYQFNYPASEYTIDDMFPAYSAMHEILMMRDPYACIQGIIYVIDFGQATHSHYLHLTPDFCKRITAFLAAVPLRIKSIYYINTAAAPQGFFANLIAHFPNNMKQKVCVLQDNLDELFKEIPLKYLQSDLNGSQGSLLELSKDFERVWQNNREYFQENALYGADEHLRPGTSFHLDNLFGECGSFSGSNGKL